MNGCIFCKKKGARMTEIIKVTSSEKELSINTFLENEVSFNLWTSFKIRNYINLNLIDYGEIRKSHFQIYTSKWIMFFLFYDILHHFIYICKTKKTFKKYSFIKYGMKNSEYHPVLSYDWLMHTFKSKCKRL